MKRREKREHKIVIICELDNSLQSETTISQYTEYISDIVQDKDTIITDIQVFPMGYKVTHTITFITKGKKKKYLKQLANLSCWLYNQQDNKVKSGLSRYYYSYL